jgi:transposase
MANQEHLDILKQGVQIWNQWREEHPDIEPDLSEARLGGALLSKADLSEANLLGADLSGADLGGTTLSKANLSGAELILQRWTQRLTPWQNGNMRAYSYDLRQRILHAVDQGKPRAEIIKTFDISRATIKRYLKLRRETGDVTPRAIPGRPAKKGAALLAGLPSQLDVYPDATLAEHCQIWESTQGIRVSSATMNRAIQRLNWTRKKKTLCASEQKEAERAAWREQAQTLDANKLIFIDECGSNIALTRLYARSLKGKRAYGAIARNRRANVTLLAALSLHGMGEALILEGSANSAVFEIYIE